MDHADHVRLLRAGIPAPGGTWADLGAGDGAFTLALAELLGPGATLHALDRDGRALGVNARRVAAAFARTRLVTHRSDFTGALPLEAASLDGVLMANSLHFVRDKAEVVRRILRAVRPGGRFLLVEYGADRGNPWVPWPISYGRWEGLAAEVGLVGTRRLEVIPSWFLGSIYSAASDVAGDAAGRGP